jgi:transcription antitermination factor NusG
MSIAATNPQVEPSSEALLLTWQELRWYVLFVRSNQERRVAQGLSERGVEHLLPCYSAIHQWKDRRVKLQLPLFPGYVFVRIPLLDRMSALTIPNVVSLVGTRNAPSVVSDEEISSIRNATLHGRAEPHPRLTEGDQVMITSGLLTGTKGILLRAHGGARVVISVESISRAFVVEVDADCVELLQKSPAVSRGALAQLPASVGFPRLRSA